MQDTKYHPDTIGFDTTDPAQLNRTNPPPYQTTVATHDYGQPMAQSAYPPGPYQQTPSGFQQGPAGYPQGPTSYTEEPKLYPRMPAEYGKGPTVVQPGFTVISGGTTTTVVSPVGVVVNGPHLGPKSSAVTCQSCNQQIMTRVEYISSMKTHIFAGVLCIVGCWPCVCIPYCVDSCKSAAHYCPNCNAYIGAYQKC